MSWKPVAGVGTHEHECVQRGVQAGCVSPIILELLLQPSICVVAQALGEGLKHHEPEEKCLVTKTRARNAWNEVSHGIVWF